MIVLASPLYCFGMTAHIKSAIDKFYAYLSQNRKTSLKVKGCALLMCGNDKGIEIFEGVLETYKHMLHYLGWRNLGSLTIPEINKKGDIEKTDALILAENLGKAI